MSVNRAHMAAARNARSGQNTRAVPVAAASARSPRAPQNHTSARTGRPASHHASHLRANGRPGAPARSQSSPGAQRAQSAQKTQPRAAQPRAARHAAPPAQKSTRDLRGQGESRRSKPPRRRKAKGKSIALVIGLFGLFCTLAGVGIAYAMGVLDLSFLAASPDPSPAKTSQSAQPVSQVEASPNESSPSEQPAPQTSSNEVFNEGSSAEAPNNSLARAPVVGAPTSVSLSAVGDNLMHTAVIDTADAAAGAMGDGQYNFTVLYEGVRDIVDSHDINFIDIETIMGGDDLGPMGYPSFNTPSQDAADIAAFGFNLATTATNHSWDQGLAGIQNSAAYWAEHPEVVVTGTFVSEEDRGTIRTFEKNGITFAFLAYQDFLNGYVLPDDQKWAIADSNDRGAVEADIKKAHELADCVIVAMSWGDEYSFVPNDAQTDLAQFFADNGVDLVLGFGPHVIQPVQWVEGKDGSGAATGHKTMVVYSLGNFVSNQHNDFNLVEGCFTCNFVRDEAGALTLADPTWIPLVCHISGYSNHSVYQLKDYSAELAATNEVLGAKADPIGYVKELTTQIIDPQVVTIAF